MLIILFEGTAVFFCGRGPLISGDFAPSIICYPFSCPHICIISKFLEILEKMCMFVTENFEHHDERRIKKKNR